MFALCLQQVMLGKAAFSIGCGLQPLQCCLAQIVQDSRPMTVQDSWSFTERVVFAWARNDQFKQLVKEITPARLDFSAISLVEEAMQRSADRVWGPDLAQLKLIGSCLYGTDILKENGQSDRDYALDTGKINVSETEWADFAKSLSQETIVDSQSVRMGSYAIKFRTLRTTTTDFAWEVTPKNGHYSNQQLTFPSLDEAESTDQRNKQRLEFYRRYQGARGAVRVLKRLLGDFPGNTIEALVYKTGNHMMRADPDIQSTDPHGLSLFRKVIFHLVEYPGDYESPVYILKKDATKFGYGAVEEKIQEAKRIAKAINRKAVGGDDDLFGPILYLLMFSGGCCGLLLSYFVESVFPKFDPPLITQSGCPDRSCFCKDCLAIWASCQRSEDLNCRFLLFEFNRCTITFLMTVSFIAAHMLILGSALAILVRVVLRRQRALFFSLFLISLSSSLALLFYVKFFGFGDFRILASKLLNVQNTLSLAISGDVLLLAKAAGQNRFAELLTPFEIHRVCRAFLPPFLLAVCIKELWMFFWEGGKLDLQQCRMQDHVFYTTTLCLQLFLSACAWFYAPSRMRPTMRELLVAQSLWQVFDAVYVILLVYFPDVKTRYNLLTDFCCLMAWTSKLVLVLYLARSTNRISWSTPVHCPKLQISSRIVQAKRDEEP